MNLMNNKHKIICGAVKLGTANAIDYAIQLILPVILVRSLDSTEFGQYRVLWLLTNTLMAFAPMYMPQSLFYFLPRSKEDKRAKYVANVLWFLFCSGLMSALVSIGIASLWFGTEKGLPAYTSVVPLFILLWVASTMLDWLANSEGLVGIQARIIVTFSVVRAFVVGGVAYWTSDILAVFWAMATFACIRVGALLFSVVSRYGLNGLQPDWTMAKEQIAYALPFGLAGSLYVLRSQGDQWIVASLFPVETFAMFSIAGVIAPLANMVRQAVSSAVLPAMNQQHSQGNRDVAMALNKQSNTLTALVLLPVLCFLFVFANEIILLIYTQKYISASGPMRVYIFGLVGQILVVNNVLITYAQGRFQLKLNLFFLLVAFSLSLVGALYFGMIGAALGTAVAQWGSHIVSIIYVKNLANVKLDDIIDIKLLIKILLNSIVAICFAWTAVQYFNFSCLMLAIIIGCICYAAILGFQFVIFPEYRSSVFEVLNQ